MSTVGSGEVFIIPVFKGFRSTVVSEVDSTGKESGGKFSSAFGNAVKGIGAGIAVGIGAAVAGIAAIAGKGLSRALNIQDAKAQLEGLGHSGETVGVIMGSALDSVKGTAFGLDAAATIAASAVAAGIKPGEALTRTLKLTADAATIAKTPLSEMGAMVNKVATNGRLTTEVLNQFQNRGVPLLQMVADQYGVTADEAAKMVTRGEVDFATFQNALEAGVGGAALSSGATARGAWANVGAAWGRLGAMFTGSAVDAAPGLFTSIAGAVDRLATGLQPLADKFSGALTPAIATFAGWIDGLDFSAVGSTIIGVFDTIKNAFTGIVSAFQSGDFSSLGSTFGSIGAIIRPMLPIFLEVGKGIGGIAGEIGKLIAAGIPLIIPVLQAFTDILGWLADNSAILTPLIIGLAGGFVIYKAAQTLANVAALASIPLDAARIGATFTLAASQFSLAGATRSATASQLASNVVQRGGIAIMASSSVLWLRDAAAKVVNTAATVGSRVAMLAGSAAMGIATAAQWALNVAMSANPIALIVIAIAALVAGLIWFFTQTELGQEIWANFTQFLSEAWNNIVAVATTVFTALADFFTAIWEGIVAFVTAYINTLVLVITTVVGFIVDVWNNYWNAFFLVISVIWEAIVSFVTAYINTVMAIINAVVSTIVAVWNGAWSAIGSFFQSVWNGIVGFVSGVVSTVSGAISGFVNNVSTGVQNVLGFITGLPDRILSIIGDLGNLLVGAGQDLFQGFIDGITGMIGNIGDAIGGVMDFIAGFFPHSPAKRGPFSGSGWRRVSEGGAALSEQFMGGFDRQSSGWDMAELMVAGRSASGLGSSTAASAASERPIYMDGTFVGWLRELANGEAQMVFAESSDGKSRKLRMGVQV
ncbi:phage tail protein [Glaciibacter superstes]|uniref:phage tail protein n=1 Tax=Glaciibacter superstes TaxID=501023 RepID=UPI0003B74ADD|nr:tape measure protein [Glaciibacter superstes]